MHPSQILVIEASEERALGLYRALEPGPYELVWARDAQEMVDFLTHATAPLVIAPLFLDDLDAFSLMRWLVLHRPEVRLVVLVEGPHPTAHAVAFASRQELTRLRPLALDAFSGQLAEVASADLLDVLALLIVTQATRLFQVICDGASGKLFVEEGRLCHAETSTETGLPAVQEMLNWASGSFFELPWEPPAERTLHGEEVLPFFWPPTAPSSSELLPLLEEGEDDPSTTSAPVPLSPGLFPLPLLGAVAASDSAESPVVEPPPTWLSARSELGSFAEQLRSGPDAREADSAEYPAFRPPETPSSLEDARPALVTPAAADSSSSLLAAFLARPREDESAEDEPTPQPSATPTEKASAEEAAGEEAEATPDEERDSDTPDENESPSEEDIAAAHAEDEAGTEGEASAEEEGESAEDGAKGEEGSHAEDEAGSAEGDEAPSEEEYAAESPEGEELPASEDLTEAGEGLPEEDEPTPTDAERPEEESFAEGSPEGEEAQNDTGTDEAHAEDDAGSADADEAAEANEEGEESPEYAAESPGGESSGGEAQEEGEESPSFAEDRESPLEEDDNGPQLDLSSDSLDEMPVARAVPDVSEVLSVEESTQSYSSSLLPVSAPAPRPSAPPVARANARPVEKPAKPLDPDKQLEEEARRVFEAMLAPATPPKPREDPAPKRRPYRPAASETLPADLIEEVSLEDGPGLGQAPEAVEEEDPEANNWADLNIDSAPSLPAVRRPESSPAQEIAAQPVPESREPSYEGEGSESSSESSEQVSFSTDETPALVVEEESNASEMSEAIPLDLDAEDEEFDAARSLLRTPPSAPAVRVPEPPSAPALSPSPALPPSFLRPPAFPFSETRPPRPDLRNMVRPGNNDAVEIPRVETLRRPDLPPSPRPEPRSDRISGMLDVVPLGTPTEPRPRPLDANDLRGNHPANTPPMGIPISRIEPRSTPPMGVPIESRTPPMGLPIESRPLPTPALSDFPRPAASLDAPRPAPPELRPIAPTQPEPRPLPASVAIDPRHTPPMGIPMIQAPPSGETPIAVAGSPMAMAARHLVEDVSEPREDDPLADLMPLLQEIAGEVPEFIAAVVLEADSGFALGGLTAREDLDAESAFAYYAEVLRLAHGPLAFLRAPLDDMLVISSSWYVLARPFDEYILGLITTRAGNPGICRRVLRRVGDKLLERISSAKGKNA